MAHKISMSHTDAARLVQVMLKHVLFNFKTHGAPDYVVNVIENTMKLQPVLDDATGSVVTADHDEFAAAYKAMMHEIAMFIVQDHPSPRAYMLHDVLMTMRYRLISAFDTLYPTQTFSKYITY